MGSKADNEGTVITEKSSGSKTKKSKKEKIEHGKTDDNAIDKKKNDSSSENSKTKKAKTGPFRRVKAEDVTIQKEELKDNSFQEFDTYGAKANKDLVVTKGKSFRHEKNKEKER